LKTNTVENRCNPITNGQSVTMPPPVIEHWASGFPPFSSLPLLLIVMAKPLTDAFYEVEAVKYGYMTLLVFSAFFAKSGQILHSSVTDNPNKSLFFYTWLIVIYAFFLFCTTLIYEGSPTELFKIVSPFVFFVLVAFAADRWMIYALVVGAVLNIIINAALLPFDFGWVMWGDIYTFKGYYFFKTDLAYSLCFSVLIYALFTRNSITPVLAILMAIAAVEIVLSNSRLNYLSFLCITVFLAVKEGISLRFIIRYALLFGMLAVIVLLLYDPTKLLGFDTSNEEAFTQGRSVVWENLLRELENYTPIEWLFGRGMFSDLLLAQKHLGSHLAHNAHNEILHLLYTQGIFGLAIYTALWGWMFYMSHSLNIPKWARGNGVMALFLFILQSTTTVMSSFATKTWPLVMIFLVLWVLSNSADQRKQLEKLS
jgi:hypothetical protein